MMNLILYFKMSLFTIIMIILTVLVGVAFLTLLERKILSYVQYRKGPNKVGLMGLFQPFSDAIKLFNKEMLIVLKSNYMIFYMCPVMLMFSMMVMWTLIPVFTNIYSLCYSTLLMFIMMSVMGYMLLLTGWSSNSMFSLMGAIRLVAQNISYEVSFMLIIFNLMILSESYSLSFMIYYQMYIWNMIILFPVFVVFFISILAEMNRSPMDLIEGESELVSGFNVEYFGGSFALIFLGEYGMIIFFSFVSLIMFTSLMYNNFLIISLMSFMILVIFMRGLLPRMRYDELMYVCWKIILPLTLSYMIFIFSFKFFVLTINFL